MRKNSREAVEIAKAELYGQLRIVALASPHEAAVRVVQVEPCLSKQHCSLGYLSGATAQNQRPMTAEIVSQQQKHALIREIVRMEIRDLALIEAIRMERRLAVLVTIDRAGKRRRRGSPQS